MSLHSTLCAVHIPRTPYDTLHTASLHSLAEVCGVFVVVAMQVNKQEPQVPLCVIQCLVHRERTSNSDRTLQLTGSCVKKVTK